MVKDKKTVLTDGPFLESKEIIGGYVIVLAEDFDEAAQFAKLADSLMRGGTGFRREGLESILGDSAVATEFRNEEEFRLYWARIQERNGFGALKRQYEIQDIDKSLIPKIYLFDSACVVFPGWVVFRKKR